MNLNPKNAMTQYDPNNIVYREGALHANGLKLAAYRVRDIKTGELSSLQFHATYGDTVLAVMGEEMAKLFSKFVEMKMTTKPDQP